ncbi:MAG: hypothetical protein VYD64_06175 [Pseudomonadota bacterium]|nr:hypothetical protein [Pseudomonadota bacterium]
MNDHDFAGPLPTQGTTSAPVFCTGGRTGDGSVTALMISEEIPVIRYHDDGTTTNPFGQDLSTAGFDPTSNKINR